MDYQGAHINVAIKRVDGSLPLPSYKTEGSVAVDLYAREAMIIEPHQVVLVPANIIVKTPPGYFFMIISRSSTPLKKGLMLANGVGIVDQDYCGEDDEIKLQLVNLGPKPVEIGRGERLAQGMFVRIDRVRWDEVDTMGVAESRGGFGTTGNY